MFKPCLGSQSAPKPASRGQVLSDPTAARLGSSPLTLDERNSLQAWRGVETFSNRCPVHTSYVLVGGLLGIRRIYIYIYVY